MDGMMTRRQALQRVWLGLAILGLLVPAIATAEITITLKNKGSSWK
jgi:hypothetical protein